MVPDEVRWWSRTLSRERKEIGMSIYEHVVSTLSGEDLDLASFKGKAVFVVNVASKCGLTPQYEGLEKLQQRYADRGFSVIGFPCNQFGGQEPGTPEDIQSFCSTTYDVTFPLTEKVDVNGQRQHPVYQELTAFPDATGKAGEVEWNFEKFLVAPNGTVAERFRPPVSPEDDQVIAAIEALLPE
jgi:glutathione peroxidase